LVPEHLVGGFLKSVTERYYFEKFPELKTQPEVLKDVIFASKPGLGAAVWDSLF
jgi:hypothetical protein